MVYAAVSLALALMLVASSSASADIRGKMITYGPHGQFSGYLVEPEGKGPFPALVVIHEWWGLNDNIKSQSDMLAKEGYVALAVDLFGKSTTDPKEAMAMVSGLDQHKASAQLLASVAYLRALPSVKHAKVGSLGWCFGGSQSLRLATLDHRLAAAVAYYGQPLTDLADIAKIKCPLLLLYGEDDQSIPVAKAREFDRALTAAGVTHEFHTYAGAGHAFANPTRTDSYRPAAAKDAWAKTLEFLRKYLKS